MPEDQSNWWTDSISVTLTSWLSVHTQATKNRTSWKEYLFSLAG